MCRTHGPRTRGEARAHNHIADIHAFDTLSDTPTGDG